MAKKMHPNSLANLQKGKFKKGEHGAVRGKGKPKLVKILQELLNTPIKMAHPISGKKTVEETAVLIMARAVKNALDGSEKSLDMILNRIEGAVQKDINITSDDQAKLDKIKEQIRKNLQENEMS